MSKNNKFKLTNNLTKQITTTQETERGGGTKNLKQKHHNRGVSYNRLSKRVTQIMCKHEGL